MKVLVLGGYGVFGGRLARLLLQDGIDVIIAGRDLGKAESFVREFGGEPLLIDAGKNLSPIAKAAPAVVVDAAGPFQAYGGDRYRVARFCIEHNINYLDFSDDADFTAGIAVLDTDAVAAGCFALSGVSSVPAISAAAVTALSEGLSEILVIESAIIPGNRAPRGRSVVASILAQTGAPLLLWRGGAWRRHSGWTDSKTIALGDGLNRPASLIGAPDIKLFPEAFQARSVLFRAGLELGIMHWGLAVIAWLRIHKLFPKPEIFLDFILWAANWLEPFGTDCGGMTVDVVATRDGEAVRRRWQVIANAGEGPFVPAVPARAIIRKMAAIKPGARPCLNDLTLAEIQDAMSGLAVEFATSEHQAPTLFQQALGERWRDLPSSLRRLHSVQDLESFSGRAKVTRGTGLFARFGAWLFRLPRAGEDVQLTVTKRRAASGEIWERNFAGRGFRSCWSASRRPFHCRERFGAFTYEQELPVNDGDLSFLVRRGWFLGIPLPALFLPKSVSREYDVDGTLHFDVGLYAPLTGALVVRYQGHLRPDCDRIASCSPIQ